MAGTAITRTQFLAVLSDIAGENADAEDLTKRLRAAIHAFGSETPDNVRCSEQLEVGPAGQEFGLKLRKQPLLLSDVAYALEDAPMPASIQDAIPGLTDQDWDAFTRLTTLIYTLLSKDAVRG